ncbi:MAG: tRNA dihydrouridine synthase DusB [bacterium]
MRIGSHTITSPALLAPMAGVTDLPFRAICSGFGAGLTTGEMVSSDARLWTSKKSSHRLRHSAEAGIRAVQIVGNEPARMADAARRQVDSGAEIIDINMGCPAKKVCKKAAGSALLRDEQLVASILESVVAAVDVPVTLKIRTGWCPQTRNGVNIARIAESSGIRALAVHGRTRACRFNGSAEYKTIAAIVKSVTIPVIANGDINSARQAKQVLEETGAAAVMIGRGAQGNPWIFRECDQLIRDGISPGAVIDEEVFQTAHQHITAIHRFYEGITGVRLARKHINWYFQRFHCFTSFRQQLNEAESADRQLHILNALMDRQLNIQASAA